MIRLASLPLLFLLLGACFALSALPAHGVSLDFSDFSIELPESWQVERDGNTVAFLAGDKSATMLVTVESIASMFKEGMSAKELAEAYAEEFKGSAPEMEDNDPNYYSFTFISPDGRDSEASIVVSGRRFYLISISGRHPDLAGMVESVLLSVQ
ncbi:hypothetical protein LJC15_02635 [Desulfovibrio sp. OttesenSCG-928-G11]|nr:hypothetical protein [Desulfovibrio sp. OttesenSCG-928-G11]